jgi:hypothetical protein
VLTVRDDERDMARNVDGNVGDTRILSMHIITEVVAEPDI